LVVRQSLPWVHPCLVVSCLVVVVHEVPGPPFLEVVVACQGVASEEGHP